MLINEGHSIADFSVMPQVVVNNYDESCDEININFGNIANEQYNQLNVDQKEIVILFCKYQILLIIMDLNVFILMDWEVLEKLVYRTFTIF